MVARRSLAATVKNRWLLGGPGIAACIALVAISLGQDTHAAGPERPFKAYAPFVASDEGRSAPAPTPSPAATPPSTPSPTPTPGAGNEINLQPQLDTAHAVSKLVTVAGGATLTTTGADGSRYTLTLPPNSLLFDVTVTMTPIKALGGLAASGGLRAGVQLQPDAMQLGVPATLDIVAASPAPVSEEISFSYSGNGHQAYAYGLDVNASRTRFTLMHFSGWAIAGGNEAQRQAFFQSRIDSAQSSLSQSMAALLAAERARQIAGTSSDEGSAAFRAEVVRLAEKQYTDVVKPAMDTAEALAESGDIDSVESAVYALLSWERTLQLMNLDILQAERAALFAQLDRIMEKVRKNMRDRCFNQHDLSMAVRLLAMARMFELVKGEGSGAQALQDAQKCLTFKLDFETVLHSPSYSPVMIFGVHARALNVPLPLFPLAPAGTFPVSTPIDLVSFDLKVNVAGACPPDGLTAAPGQPFTVYSARLIPSWSAGKLEIKDIAIGMRPGTAPGTWTGHFCNSRGDKEGDDITISWEGLFLWFYESRSGLLGADGFLISNWDIIGGGVFARKTYSGGENNETTTFDLKHAPE